MRNGADCTWAEGNCLFLWPAAKGEKVNRKGYETACLLRQWIRCKLEEEAFQSQALAFPHSYQSRLFSAFCSTASFLPLIFFLYSFFPFSYIFISSPSPLPPPPPGYIAAGFCGCAAWQVELGEVKRARAGFLQIVRQKAETARPSVRTQCEARIARPRRVTKNHDLEPWAEKKIQHKSIESGHELTGPSAPCMCALVGIWCFAQNGLHRAPHVLMWKPRILQSTAER